MNLKLTSIVSRSSDPVWANMDNEVVMMSVQQSRYFGLDDIGSRIWLLMSEPISVTELHKHLMEEYEVDNKTCETDLLSLLGSLADQNLIEVN
ncbi:MAG: lasso peptide biosynthesis PqqD family chaperone [Pseudomonadota bacterium]